VKERNSSLGCQKMVLEIEGDDLSKIDYRVDSVDEGIRVIKSILAI
jgi:hypothetical protein